MNEFFLDFYSYLKNERNKLGRSRSVINKKLFNLEKFIIDRDRKVNLVQVAKMITLSHFISQRYYKN